MPKRRDDQTNDNAIEDTDPALFSADPMADDRMARPGAALHPAWTAFRDRGYLGKPGFACRAYAGHIGRSCRRLCHWCHIGRGLRGCDDAVSGNKAQSAPNPQRIPSHSGLCARPDPHPLVRLWHGAQSRHDDPAGLLPHHVRSARWHALNAAIHAGSCVHCPGQSHTDTCLVASAPCPAATGSQHPDCRHLCADRRGDWRVDRRIKGAWLSDVDGQCPHANRVDVCGSGVDRRHDPDPA